MDARDAIDEYFEARGALVQRGYYHGTRYPLPLGAILRPGGKAKVGDDESRAVEDILERFRPANETARHLCVFMSDSPDPEHIEKAGGYGDHVYSVEPLGQVWRNDVGWWAQILNDGAIDWMLDKDPAALEACRPMAEAYWAGKASARPHWEYRTKRAKIVARVGGWR